MFRLVDGSDADWVPTDAAADWSRERPRHRHEYGPRLLRCIRGYQRAAGLKGLRAALLRRYWVLQHLFWSVVTQCEIHVGTRIGGGLRLTHANGIVIHPSAVIGTNCLIFQQVTIGSNGKGVPTIGNGVDIGAGAKLLGPITVGDNAIIGANAVVLQDVPPGATAVGIPARIITAKRMDRLTRFKTRDHGD